MNVNINENKLIQKKLVVNEIWLFQFGFQLEFTPYN